MKPRKLLLENSINDNGEPTDNFITVKNAKDALSDFVMCPICKDPLKSILTSMSCLHRFCDECITRHLMITQHKNCPLCRHALASRRNARKDPNYDKLVTMLLRTSQKESSLSKAELQELRRKHELQTEKFRNMSRERMFQAENKNQTSSSSMLGKRSHSAETTNVNFILKPEPNSSGNNDSDILKKPYIKASSQVNVNDLINFLKAKVQFQSTDFDILIKFKEELILLSGEDTLLSICTRFYKDATSELALYFRKKNA